jgi:RNA polymerase sigma factor (sigma-70 family)
VSDGVKDRGGAGRAPASQFSSTASTVSIERVTSSSPHSVQEAGRSSFDDLVATHKRRVYYLALDLTGSHHDAEDLSQEVFIKAFENLDSFRGDAKLFTWLYRIAVNTFLNQTRRKAWQAEQLQEDLDDTDGTATGLPASDERAERRQMQAHIEASLQALSPRERTASPPPPRAPSPSSPAGASRFAAGTDRCRHRRGTARRWR